MPIKIQKDLENTKQEILAIIAANTTADTAEDANKYLSVIQTLIIKIDELLKPPGQPQQTEEVVVNGNNVNNHDNDNNNNTQDDLPTGFALIIGDKLNYAGLLKLNLNQLLQVNINTLTDKQKLELVFFILNNRERYVDEDDNKLSEYLNTLLSDVEKK